MQKKRIVILGAGISGLALAWFLRKKIGDSAEITILDRSSRPGGWIQTIQKGGFLFEQGPHSFRPRGTGLATLRLVEDLRLQDEIIFADPAAAKRYLFFNQKLQQFPTNPFSFLFSPVTQGVLSAIFKDLREPKFAGEDESIFDFISRRFGNEIANRLMDPLVSGIYAGDIQRLSIRSCFPLLHQWEQEHGSIIKGLWHHQANEPLTEFSKESQKKGLFSFQNGMETLIKTLVSKLKSLLKLSVSIQGILPKSNGIEIAMSNEVIQADHVFSAMPSKALGELMTPQNAELGRVLQSIEHASLAIVNMGFKIQVLEKKGFGYLIPSSENQGILGVIWDSCVFPQQNCHPLETRLTVMLGGARMNGVIDLDDSEIQSRAFSAIKEHLNIVCDPDEMHVKKVKEAIPQYVIGHHRTISCIEKELSNISPYLTCLGSSFYGVSINDCIANAEKAAQNFCCYTHRE